MELTCNPLYTGNPYTDTLANNDDPDEMQQRLFAEIKITFKDRNTS